MNFKLGKKEHKADENTLMLANFMAPVAVPAKYDFDSGRKPFPLKVWGNDQWGDCVCASQANALLRMERLEQRRTLPLTDEMVVKQYADESEREFGVRPKKPGDSGDQGLVTLEMLKHWRNLGWNLDFTIKTGDTRNYRIAAYGELDPTDYEQLKAGCYLLHGVIFGFWLPIAANRMTRDGLWDYTGESGDEWKPGSWGGHAVYAKAYDGDNFEVLTWGMKVKVSKRFIMKYADEAWCAVDNFDTWRSRRDIDVTGMIAYLKEIGARNAETL